MDRSKAHVAAALLEQVASGELDASVALSEWPQDAEGDELLNASWHDLSHFAVDIDIRMKDPRYEAHQLSLLLGRAKQIRERHRVV